PPWPSATSAVNSFFMLRPVQTCLRVPHPRFLRVGSYEQRLDPLLLGFGTGLLRARPQDSKFSIVMPTSEVLEGAPSSSFEGGSWVPRASHGRSPPRRDAACCAPCPQNR